LDARLQSQKLALAIRRVVRDARDAAQMLRQFIDLDIILSGERGRNRTFNLLIKSQLLCQLSYAPGSRKQKLQDAVAG
jgi:hypothetical protein